MKKLLLLLLLMVAFLPAFVMAESGIPAKTIGPNADLRVRSATMARSRLTAITIANLPASGQSVGDSYLVSDATDSSDCTVGGADPGVPHECMWVGSTWSAKNAGAGAAGEKGWAPVLALVTDGARTVYEVVDWTGGAGDKPTALGYVGATGIVALVADAVDVVGSYWYSGFDTPANATPVVVGKDGDFFQDTSIESKLFRKISGTWTEIGSNKGQAGTNGTSSFTYIAYASDASGTGFALTPGSLKYRAEIVSATVIASPDADDFAAATWVKFVGDDGSPGATGANGQGFSECDPTGQSATLPLCGFEVACNTQAVSSWADPTDDEGSIRCFTDGTNNFYYQFDPVSKWVAIGSGSSLPTGCTDDDILVADAAEETGWKCIAMTEHPAYIALMDAAGLNSFTFAPETPASYPYYSDSGTFNLDFTVTDSSDLYTVAGVRYQLDAGGYDGNTASDQGSSVWRVALADLTDDSYVLQLEATDSKGTANSGESTDYTLIVDTTDPVLVAGADDTFTSADTDIECTVAQTEANPQAPTYTITGDISATGTGTDDGGGNYSTPILDVSGLSAGDDFTCTWASTDLAGNEATGTDLVQVFTYEESITNLVTDGDFSGDGSAWGGQQYTISGGSCRVEVTTGYSYVRQESVALVEGHTYNYSFTISSITADASDMNFQCPPATIIVDFSAGNGTYTGTFVKAAGDNTIRFFVNSSTAGRGFTIDNIQIWE